MNNSTKGSRMARRVAGSVAAALLLSLSPAAYAAPPLARVDRLPGIAPGVKPPAIGPVVKLPGIAPGVKLTGIGPEVKVDVPIGIRRCLTLDCRPLDLVPQPPPLLTQLRRCHDGSLQIACPEPAVDLQKILRDTPALDFSLR